MKRMISKLEATDCLDDRVLSGRSKTSANAARTVQEEIDILVGSSMHGEIIAVAFHTQVFG